MDPEERTLPTKRVAIAPQKSRRPGRLVLRVLDGPSPGQTFDIAKTAITVGRSSLADARVAHPSVSSLHFKLGISSSGALLRDLGSKNGVVFGGRRVEAVNLEPGDMFSAGECRFVLADVAEVEVDTFPVASFGSLQGSSLAMRELYAQISALAPTPLDILILGETGTGKELTARTVHEVSRRRGPLIVLDCGALSPSLAEGTIFGFTKGAFTGADRDQAGVFEAAHGGTLFIDEVGELSLELQVKLLRALDNREVTRLGEPGRSRTVDVRVIAATHRDLRQAVTEGVFREDLYYRLARAVLHTPPLRERDDDIVALAELFLGRVCRDYGLEVFLADDAARAIRSYAWPGNVRELRNVIERSAHLKRRGALVAADLRLTRTRASMPSSGFEPLSFADKNYYEIHAEIDHMLLSRLLEEHAHNISHMAQRLGISRDKLRARLRELGLYSRS